MAILEPAPEGCARIGHYHRVLDSILAPAALTSGIIFLNLRSKSI